MESLRRKQNASLLTLLIAASLFALHWVVGGFFDWNDWLVVVAYALFNVIKGFAGGLSEEWNESLVHYYPKHDEARFMTLSALFGRLYQIAAIAFYFVLNQFANSSGSKEATAFVGTLTIAIFVLAGANLLAFLWINHGKQQYESIWNILRKAVVEPEERTALFTQLLRALFFGSLILANWLSLKAVYFKGLTFVHGSIFYITLFVLINLITVFEDVGAAIKTVFLGMIVYVFITVALVLSANVGGHLVDESLLPVTNYNFLLGEWAKLYGASFCAYTVTVILNVVLLTALSRQFGTRSPLVLGAVVTFICQAIDTLIFILLGYSNTKEDLPSMIIGQFSVKFSLYLVMYFPLYYVIQACKKWVVPGKVSM
jgi:uncharacterized integral membrane protein (TIGR00697 family)